MSALSAPCDDVDLALFASAYPDKWGRLCARGYEECGPGMLGRVCGRVTFFIDISPAKGRVQAWAWEIGTERYLGPLVEVAGPLGPASAHAMHVIESRLQEHELSQDLPRYLEPPVERHEAIV